MTTKTQELHPLCIVVANEIVSKREVQFNEAFFNRLDSYLLNLEDPETLPSEMVVDLHTETDLPELDIYCHLHMHMVYTQFIAYAKKFFDIKFIEYSQAYTLLQVFKERRPSLFFVDY